MGAGGGHLTLKQLESFAAATHAPVGYFFLPEPPEERLPIPDFRTVSGAGPGQPRRPSPDLLDTIYAMQQRQMWLRDTLVDGEGEPLQFVSSARLSDDPEAIGRKCGALSVRVMIGRVPCVPGKRLSASSACHRAAWGHGRRQRYGGNNTHRPLDVDEFRGFALSDAYAPLIFINGADARSAQMFTLAHELAHIWLGVEGLSGFAAVFPGGTDVEDRCNRAAAEFLVPARQMRARWSEVRREASPFELLARRFKVSPIVVGRRALDLGLVDRDDFFDFYREYTGRERTRAAKTSGGDFYSNQNTRVGEYFAGHVVRAALEGRVGFKEAYGLTDLRGGAFQEYAQRLGFGL